VICIVHKQTGVRAIESEGVWPSFSILFPYCFPYSAGSKGVRPWPQRHRPVPCNEHGETGGTIECKGLGLSLCQNAHHLNEVGVGKVVSEATGMHFVLRQ